MIDLSIDEIYIGIKKCHENSSELIDDGNYLYNDKRYSRAYSIFQLATEESAKIKILIRLALDKLAGKSLTKDDRKPYNKIFTDHIAKNRYAVSTDLEYYKLSQKINLPIVRDPNKIINEINNPKQLDIFKQNGLYVSLMHNKFKKPSEIINKAKCTELQDVVTQRFKMIESTMNHFLSHTDFMVEKWRQTLPNNK